MKSLRIINAVPSFYEIYLLFPHTNKSIYVFEDSYTFKSEELPTDEEFEIIDKNTIELDGQLILTAEMVDKFAPHFNVTANCVHAYDTIHQITKEHIQFKSRKWDWTYFCWDDTDIEIFINADKTDTFNTIKKSFDCLDIEFPGSITFSGGMPRLLK